MIDCPREADVLDAIVFARGAGVSADALAGHVAGCPICSDLVEIARTLHDDRAAALGDAHPPTAAVMWWRATIRARAEAARTAMRPITVLQGVAGACVAGATMALATVAWRSIDIGARLGELVSRVALEQSARAGLTFDHAAVIVATLVACLVLAPVALFLTLADD
jgi:hypothetical protein